ncbi:translation initiation factor IF-2-like [Antechinus flavipes]|uniref:translation initiation factor IF-2-like n=1 Tax=Antechinus flavipes TaxID=38775 RepID=UPI0022356836|nr:translation initiation factor IF-2-like [Antechinus flavipes]
MPSSTGPAFCQSQRAGALPTLVDPRGPSLCIDSESQIGGLGGWSFPFQAWPEEPGFARTRGVRYLLPFLLLRWPPPLPPPIPSPAQSSRCCLPAGGSGCQSVLGETISAAGLAEGTVFPQDQHPCSPTPGSGASRSPGTGSPSLGANCLSHRWRKRREGELEPERGGGGGGGGKREGKGGEERPRPRAGRTGAEWIWRSRSQVGWGIAAAPLWCQDRAGPGGGGQGTAFSDLKSLLI